MKARNLIDSACATYSRETLRVIGKAFDDAWAIIAPEISNRAEAIEAARTHLAEAILELVKIGPVDAATLTNAAIQSMTRKTDNTSD